MPVTVRSFAKINLGLCIGGLRPDGFHQLQTVYQTVALNDVIRVSVQRGEGIEIRCEDSRVPTDHTNTCYGIAERALQALNGRGKVLIEIEKRLPIQGGLGGASGNAVASLLALERALKKQLPGAEKLNMASQVGSDLPLFLIGGTVLGVGRGEEVYPVPDLPPLHCVIATPDVGISTPKAFADWDLISSARSTGTPAKLTLSSHSDRMWEFGRKLSAWLSGLSQSKKKPLSGVPAKGRGRAETLLLDLVRTGIENDFEHVVFPQYPALREVKCLLQRAGASYASLSGSGSAVYGLFSSRAAAQKAALTLQMEGLRGQVTMTLSRRQYWSKVFDC